MLKTERLRMRELTSADLEKVHELLSLPETDEFNTLGIPENIESTERLLTEWVDAKGQYPRISYVSCIEQNDDRRFVGLIAMNLGKAKYRTGEVWFKIHKEFWQRGYTTEALIAFLGLGFYGLKLHRIEAGCAVENIASIRVLEKAGMIKEGMTRKKLPIRGEWKDSYFYGILEEEFQATN